MSRKRNILGQPSLVRIREENVSLKRLLVLEEALDIPPQEGFHFTEPERVFIRDVRRKHSASLELTMSQREKIKTIWEAVRKAKAAAL